MQAGLRHAPNMRRTQLGHEHARHVSALLKKLCRGEYSNDAAEVSWGQKSDNVMIRVKTRVRPASVPRLFNVLWPQLLPGSE